LLVISCIKRGKIRHVKHKWLKEHNLVAFP